MLPFKTTVLLTSAVTAIIALVASGVTALPAKQDESNYFASSESSVAPLFMDTNADTIEGSYIVILKPNLTEKQIETHHTMLNTLLALHGGFADEGGENQLRHVYEMKSLKGYSGKFTDALVDRIRTTPEVSFVERDSTVYTTSLERNAPWGLARISHRNSLTFRTFNKYLYDARGGTGITAYIVDTGVNIHHNDFGGRAEWGITVPEGDPDSDGNGHGSHVAGTVAGRRYGVAKKANVVAVKVLRSNGSGTTSDVIRGISWTAEDHQRREDEAARSKTRKRRASVANMSLGGGYSKALNLAVDAAVDAGVHYAVAAGNDNRDACNYSPASAASAITVGATGIDDSRAWFSNYGKCTDVFAPGKDITSIWIGSRTATNTISGTSMASPHVAGLLAYLLSLETSPGSISPTKLKKKVIQLATKGVLDDIPQDTPNALIYTDPPNHLYDDHQGASGWISWVKKIADEIFISF